MKTIIAENYNEASKLSAKLIADQIKVNPKSVLGFATGSTPEGAYRELVGMYEAGEINFSGVTTFNLDEYYPILRTNDQSYYYFMMNSLFSHVNIPAGNINIPDGEAADTDTECADYEKKIEAAGGIDFQVLGIGLNGHIGFNEPNDHFTNVTNFVALHESTIEANARFFETMDEVPKHAISMGIGTIMRAKKILLMISGEHKADIAKEAVFGNITPGVPASVLQLHADVTVVLDKDAAKLF